MNSLLLTLGHNSSAILIKDGQIQWGYETERITGVKSDSRFPKAVFDFVKTPFRPDIVYVTHWAPDGNLTNMSSKHWDPYCFDGVPIRTLSVDRSHHDTHMAGAMAYAGPNFPRHRAYGLVIDGFGTLGEHFSVYDLSSGKPALIQRVHGYDTSLGLWYQYATAFMGLKMHEDEYKLLGYEVHVPPPKMAALSTDAMIYAADWIQRMRKSVYTSRFDPMYDLDALANVKAHIFKHLASVCVDHDIPGVMTLEGRAMLAFYVQAVLEAVVITRVRALNPMHLVVSGGVFYNVKLNKCLIDLVPGQFCAYPLAGDQGNALGLYAMDHPDFQLDRSLCWGVRELKDVGEVPGLHVLNESEAYTKVCQKLLTTGYVNLVRGNMEFGPRALCNTSTLAMPTSDIVRRINEANNRNTVMPMAPVMTMEMYRKLFDNTTKVWRSHAHMICAMEYTLPPPDEMRGVAHAYEYPYPHFTGRPQVVDFSDTFMTMLLHEFDTPLINTSFNFHGQPIALGMESIIKNHMMQYQRDNSFTTVVIKND